jgi:hypothetical protein
MMCNLLLYRCTGGAIPSDGYSRVGKTIKKKYCMQISLIYVCTVQSYCVLMAFPMYLGLLVF